jgi:hypothetical protein
LIVDSHGGENRFVVSPRHVLGNGIGETLSLRILSTYLDDFFGLRIGQRLKKNLIHHTKDSGIRADSQRQRSHRY